MDENAQEHRDQFVALIRELKATFRPDNFLVSLTVLPNVNSTGKFQEAIRKLWKSPYFAAVYYDPRGLAPSVDFVTLHAFDFYTAQRNPKLADFPAPLYDLIDRRQDENIDAWVKYW